MTDVRQYCREVEGHLTRVNAGHLVRIVGPGFELVRRWADQGIPLSVVFRGIDLKADRQHASHGGEERAAKLSRPLRIEFCEADVRDVYEGWRRAVGLPAPRVPEADTTPDTVARRPSLTKHLDRAIDRLARAGGSVNLPEALRDAVGGVLGELGVVRESAKGARGPVRAELVHQLTDLDRQLLAAARAAAAPPALDALAHEAENELAPFRDRLPADAWQTAVEATVDRLLRDQFGLPTLELHA